MAPWRAEKALRVKPGGLPDQRERAGTDPEHDLIKRALQRHRAAAGS